MFGANMKNGTVIWEKRSDNAGFVFNTGEKKQSVFIFEGGGVDTMEYNLTEDGGQLELLIVFVGKIEDMCRLVVNVNHLASRTAAKVKLKAVLFDKSQLDFKGNIFVGVEGHGTDTYLKCESLLMSPRAVAKVIPSLEIIANDVKAGHAATVGRLDEDSYFYLESRGLRREVAERMLMEAFLAEEKSFFSEISESEREEVERKLIELLP